MPEIGPTSRAQLRKNRRQDLIVALANFLSRDLGKKSCLLSLGPLHPSYSVMSEWRDIFSRAGLCGYPTFDQALEALEEILG